MPGSSRVWRVALPVAVMGILSGACASNNITPAATTVAPMPRLYSCQQFKQASDEYRALPAGSILATMMDDYRGERLVLFRLNGLKEPPPCKP